MAAVAEKGKDEEPSEQGGMGSSGSGNSFARTLYRTPLASAFPRCVIIDKSIFMPQSGCLSNDRPRCVTTSGACRDGRSNARLKAPISIETGARINVARRR